MADEEMVNEETIDHGWLLDGRRHLETYAERIIGEINKVSRPQIQRVPEYMGARAEFRKFYSPQLVSMGPIHYDEPYVERGKPYKDAWTAMYLKRMNVTSDDFIELCERIFSHMSQLAQQYTGVSWWMLENRADASWMFLVDGCSVLEVLEKSDHSVDPEQELKISIDKLVLVHQDLLLLENQIPFEVLKFICSDEARLNKCLQNFLKVHGIKTARMPSTGKPYLGKEKENESTDGQAAEEHKVTVQADEEEPVHLLDYLRRALLMGDRGTIHKEIKIRRKSLHLQKYRIGSIRELKAAGIRVRKDPNSSSFYPSFNDGILQLPELTVDGSTELIFLNLIAYEMCPEFRNDLEISSFVVFLSSLIDQPEDVKELRSAGILINQLASDKEAADLFNRIDFVLVPETAWFAHVRDQIQEHFESKRGKIKMLGWMGEAYNTFFRSPWTVIALLAATLGLVLTFIQTWFAIHPKGS